MPCSESSLHFSFPDNFNKIHVGECDIYKVACKLPQTLLACPLIHYTCRIIIFAYSSIASVVQCSNVSPTQSDNANRRVFQFIIFVK